MNYLTIFQSLHQHFLAEPTPSGIYSRQRSLDARRNAQDLADMEALRDRAIRDADLLVFELQFEVEKAAVELAIVKARLAAAQARQQRLNPTA